MIEASNAQTASAKTENKIIVALDVETAGEARAIIKELGEL
jgi:orotidine-5'-phosphate decarboxylase